MNAKLSGGERLQLLAEKGCNQTSEHIARAPRSHTGIAGRVAIDAPAVGHDCALSLQDKNNSMIVGETHGKLLPLALHGWHVAVQKAGELTGMGGEDQRSRVAFEAFGVML